MRTRPFQTGLIGSLIVLGISGLWMGFFQSILKFDVVEFMLRGPIALLFGIFFVSNLTQSFMFAERRQPIRGLLLITIALPLGLGLEELYRFSAPFIVGRALPSGPPGYDLELWVATALLAVTFPLIVIVSGYFDFWPVARIEKNRDG